MAGRGAGRAEHFVRMVIALVDYPVRVEMFCDTETDAAGAASDDEIGNRFRFVQMGFFAVASKAAMRASVRCMFEFWPR